MFLTHFKFYFSQSGQFLNVFLCFFFTWIFSKLVFWERKNVTKKVPKTCARVVGFFHVCLHILLVRKFITTNWTILFFRCFLDFFIFWYIFRKLPNSYFIVSQNLSYLTICKEWDRLYTCNLPHPNDTKAELNLWQCYWSPCIHHMFPSHAFTAHGVLHWTLLWTPCHNIHKRFSVLVYMSEFWSWSASVKDGKMEDKIWTKGLNFNLFFWNVFKDNLLHQQ